MGADRRAVGRPARVFGGYSEGCLAGAVALPLDGPGYQVVRPARHRHYGHPELVAFVGRLAAMDPMVARIFVNPAIKRALCARHAGGAGDDRHNASWLRVVTPWPGHDSHMHVRLNCPPGDPGCESQAPPPPGTGCGGAPGGAGAAADFVRLFMVPGMDPCGLLPGPGIDQSGFDPLAALEAWVEDGTAPDRLPSVRADAASFVCTAP